MHYEFSEIKYYYQLGDEAYGNADYINAASMFRKCWEIYNEADFSFFNADIQNLGEDAFERYNFIVSKHLGGDGFDLLEYEV